ncbi:MAG: hypothetical protein AAGA54_28520 [Myxococcota bacterium]
MNHSGGIVLVGALASAAAGCIIPDTDIDVQPNRTNPGTVRIVQAVPLTQEADDACGLEPGLEVCLVPPFTVVPGLIEVENQAFCVCEGGRDLNALGGFDIYVEDPDVTSEGDPRDDIFGVFLLDAPADAQQVAPFIAYTNFLPSNRPAQRVPLGGAGTYAQPIERPPTNLKSWTLGIETAVDLCNDNNGTALEPGLHSLRIIVTDRPWPFPVELGPQGEPSVEGDGFARDETEDPLVGIPDTVAGASHAAANFVFRCEDEASEAGAAVCNCEEVEG